MKKAKYCLDLILIPKNTIVLGNDEGHANFYFPRANVDEGGSHGYEDITGG